VNLARRHPIAAYFLLTFVISWTGALILSAPYLARHESVPKFSGLMMFPVMLLGPALSGVTMTGFVDGRAGLRGLLRGMRRASAGVWYALLLIPPTLVLAVLLALSNFVSPRFTPNHFVVGVSFGLVAGFLEEIGWMGYAFPKMRLARSFFPAAVTLGLLWSLWHLPVVDFLGAATPHGNYWLAFFLAFTAAMTAMRVLIAFVYVRTESVLVAQLLHASSTGSLVVFSPPGVSPSDEAVWYAIYACALSVVAGILVMRRQPGAMLF
jgi:membrane protease YdiL (CAAX protease family)